MLLIDSATNNTIGGSGAGQGNVISGNGGDGVSLSSTSCNGNLVIGNYIGTDKNGTAAMGNSGNGITVNSSGNTIGGNWYEGKGNVISANGGYGISFATSAAGNSVQGSYIGTDKNGNGQLVNGQNVLGNANDGIYIAGFCNVIGGVVDNAHTVFGGNIVSGNKGDGIDIGGGVSNSVQGNWIGLDGSGGASLGNLRNGAEITAGAWDNTIGGASADQGNVISGNGSQPDSTQDNGVYIADGANNNYLWNNYIGTDESGTVKIANWGDGVYIEVTAGGGNEVGGANGQGNVISGNGATANSVSGYGIDIRVADTIESWNTIGLDVNGNLLQNKAGGSESGNYGPNDTHQ